MLLCDIGNTTANFLDKQKFYSMSIDQFLKYEPTQKIFYINVNPNLNQKLKNHPLFIDLAPYFNFDTIYKNLGIDRIAACYTIEDGVIVDAGSAITVDIVSNFIHLGGFILPGIESYKSSFANISSKLKHELNTQINFDAFPQKTIDALSYGTFKSIYLLIKDCAYNKKLYFTGGDGQFLANFFDYAIYDKLLIFRGMKKVVDENYKL
ncbi:type III pantothenate kinase [Campylobacter sp.]|uniref:type III pantothenate kinase n=1 Tax=Campylobacter sp. TaxID=205 RepID=UPI0025BF7EDA|nr:type III pantothenate kinase [Campylobacter sp.]